MPVIYGLLWHLFDLFHHMHALDAEGTRHPRAADVGMRPTLHVQGSKPA